MSIVSPQPVNGHSAKPSTAPKAAPPADESKHRSRPLGLMRDELDPLIEYQVEDMQGITDPVEMLVSGKRLQELLDARDSIGKAEPPPETAPPLRLTKDELAILREQRAGNTETVEKESGPGEPREVRCALPDSKVGVAQRTVRRRRRDLRRLEEKVAREKELLENAERCLKEEIAFIELHAHVIVGSDDEAAAAEEAQEAIDAHLRECGRFALGHALEQYEEALRADQDSDALIATRPDSITFKAEMERMDLLDFIHKAMWAAKRHLIDCAFRAATVVGPFTQKHDMAGLHDRKPFALRCRDKLVVIMPGEDENGDPAYGRDKLAVVVLDGDSFGELDEAGEDD